MGISCYMAVPFLGFGAAAGTGLMGISTTVARSGDLGSRALGITLKVAEIILIGAAAGTRLMDIIGAVARGGDRGRAPMGITSRVAASC